MSPESSPRQPSAERTPLPDSINSFSGLELGPEIKTVLLDLDNTFYKYDPCHKEGFAAAQALLTSWEWYQAGIPDFKERYERAQEKTKKLAANTGSSHSRLFYFQNLLEELEDAEKYSRSLLLEEAYWSAFMDAMVVSDGLAEFLTHCKADGKKIVIVSDLTSQIQFKKIAKLGIEKYIDRVITSEEVAAEKPNPKPFMCALEKVDGSVDSAVMIGDNPDKDIVGAKALGIPAILFTHAETPANTPVR